MGNPEVMHETAREIALEVSDASGQKVVSVPNVPTTNTVGELVSELVSKLQLPMNDTSGAPLTYEALLDREQRHLNASESIATLQNLDRLTLMPSIDAGLN